MTYHPELRGLEHAAELEKPFAVAGVAYAAAEKEGRNAGARGAEGGAAFALQEKRCGPRNGLKKSQFQVHRRKRAVGSWTLVEPAEIGFRAEAPPGNHGIIGVVQQVAQPGLSHTTRHGRNFRCAQSQLGIQRANLVANAQFTEAPETVPYVAADVDA